MQFKKILVVVDPKHGRQPALKRAAWLAKQASASLELLLVEYNSSFDGFHLFGANEDKGKESLLANKHEWLDTLAKPFRDEGIEVATAVRWSKVSYKAVLDYADEIKPDIIFKSAYSEGMLKRLFITNSCWQLIRNCTIPLWLVQHGDWEGNKLCAALDPMHISDKPAYLDNELIKIATELSKTLNMSANYLHSFAAMPRPQLFGGDQVSAYDEYLKNFISEHTEAFKNLLSQYPEITQEQQFLLEGFAEEVIPNFVKDHQIGLIIMGAVARGSLDNMLIGHTAERILEAIECDLLVIHPQTTATEE